MTQCTFGHTASANPVRLKAMGPVVQQGELEADELGLLMASVAGYAPDAQLQFIEREAEFDTGGARLVSTHPPAQVRLDQLKARPPWARRLFIEGPGAAESSGFEAR